MSNDNTQQTGNTEQQQTDEQKLKKAREALDEVRTTDNLYYSYNKTRKKLKRWFDRCAKKPFNEAKKDDLCYGFQGSDVLLGKRDKDDTNNIRCPFLIIKEDGSIAMQTDSKYYNIESMSYDDFYKSYKAIFGKNAFLSFFENAWDGFMSITQAPRQKISRNRGKATSIGGHVANIATRVFSPVIATGYGLCAVAVAAYNGAKALKDKLIPDVEELRTMSEKEREHLNEKYTNTVDDDLNKLQQGLINNWSSGNMKGMSYNNLKGVLNENKRIYGNPPPKTNLDKVNNASPITEKQ